MITGTPETVQFFIPMENIAFVERIPDFDEDEEDTGKKADEKDKG